MVFFPGFQEDVRPFLATMDIFMMTSIIEGLPVALLEAMSMGLPVVSTPVGGIVEVVKDGAGFLVTADKGGSPSSSQMQRSGRLGNPDIIDPAPFLRVVLKLVDNPSLCRGMGQVARRTVAEDHSIQTMVRKLEALYLDVLERRAKNAG